MTLCLGTSRKQSGQMWHRELLGCRISQKDGALRARIIAEQGPEPGWAAPDLREQDGDVQGHSGLGHRCFPGL